MAKRYTYKYCGRYFYGVSYSMPGAADTQEAKRDRQRCVSEARQKINDKRAAVQFEQLMATNFTPSDLVVTLTYRDDALPHTLDAAKKITKKFLSMLRQSYRLAGQELKYLLVHEGSHGDHRMHHHIVVNAIPDVQEIIRGHWAKWGDNLDFSRIDLKGYTAWAKYLCKELLHTGRLRPGQHAWSPSRNLTRPVVEQGECSDIMDISPPPGSVILENETTTTEYGAIHYIKCILPMWAVKPVQQKPPQKPRRRRKK